ncbi:MAG: hypothetical protein EA397_11615 [Deltaproteobacteria bacterium]|nr:MAG: hypothetical protein EA397_11615 [Deltaproteobacteria bacterium]
MSEAEARRRAAERTALEEVAEAFGLDPTQLAGMLAAGDPKVFSQSMLPPDPKRVSNIVGGLVAQLRLASEQLSQHAEALAPPSLDLDGVELPEGVPEALDSITEFQADLQGSLDQFVKLGRDIERALSPLDDGAEARVDALDQRFTLASMQIADRLEEHRYLLDMLRDLLGRIPGEYAEAAKEARLVTTKLGPEAGQGWARLIAAERLGQHDLARSLVAQLVPLCTAAEAPELIPYALARLQALEPIGTDEGLALALSRGLALLNADRIHEGETLLHTVMEHAAQREQGMLQARAILGLAQAAELSDRPDEALAHYDRLVEQLPSEGPAARLRARAALAVARLSPEQARAALKIAALSAAHAGATPLLAEASIQAARLADQANDPEEALRLLFAARTAVDGLDDDASQRLTDEAVALGKAWGADRFRDILDRLSGSSR